MAKPTYLQRWQIFHLAPREVPGRSDEDCKRAGTALASIWKRWRRRCAANRVKSSILLTPVFKIRQDFYAAGVACRYWIGPDAICSGGEKIHLLRCIQREERIPSLSSSTGFWQTRRKAPE